MDKQDIKELMQQFDQSSLNKFKLKKSDFELSFSKEINFDLSQADSARLMQASSQSIDPNADLKQAEENNLVEVRSPMVGTFYASGEEGGKPYVEVGDQIKAGQIVCIIDVMKTMNEIPAPVDGKVVSIHAEDGELMEFDSLLMILDTENVS
ncbi:MAG: acetyl-CoA carboxylase biotin carboxyl carrier protein [Clostridiaceae bacterium]|nr:acetyl-CoA carboxylase biotin carboxyl carrier protein [Clostridiaceae bacterium]